MRRRTFLYRASSTAGVVSLTGCAMPSMNAEPELDSRATLGRIALRADTERAEQVDLTLVYAPPDDSTTRPVWGNYVAPASGDVVTVSDFEGTPGFYSLTARSVTHDSIEVVSFNSYGNAVGEGPLQFEVVIQWSGDVWASVNGAGESISIPGS